MAIDLTVQLCTYNRKELLLRALDALMHQDYPKDRYEIVLIDDGSTDGTRESIENLKPKCGFKYIYQENSGLAVGRNKGIKEAKGEIILFVDDDILASRQLVSQHVITHKNFSKSVVRGWVNHVDSLDNFSRDFDKSKLKFTAQDCSTSFFWTSNVSVARKYLDEAGHFDEAFKEYGWEDLEIGVRLKKLGLKLKYNEDAIVLHYKGCWKKSQLPSRLNQARSKGRTAVLFLQKHPTLKVKMATGIYTARILWDSLLNLGGLGRKICEKILEKHPSDELSGIALLCAQQLYTFEYFKTIKEAIT